MIRVYSFQARFVDAIQQSTKPHTIRAFRRAGRVAAPGDDLHLYTALRTKTARRIGMVLCDATEEITIRPGDNCVGLTVVLGNCILSPGEIDALAKDDGFDDHVAFGAFFVDQRRPVFRGLLIRWKPELLVYEGA